MNQQTRTLVMFAVIAVALAIVFLWNRRERAEEAAAIARDAATPGSAAPPPATGAGSATPFRRLDKPARAALLARMQAARGAAPSAGAPASAGATTGSPRPSLAPLPGSLEAKDVQRGVRELIPLLAECYDAALPRLTQKAGNLVVHMKFTGEPEVGTLIESAEITGDEPLTRDPELMECLQQTMLSIELPPLRERGDVAVTYPLAFSPGD